MALRPVSLTVKPKRMTAMTSVSLAANASGVNSVTSSVSPIAAKKPGSSSFPRRTPCQGAIVLAGSDAQSTSSVTTSRIAETSPWPNAS